MAYIDHSYVSTRAADFGGTFAITVNPYQWVLLVNLASYYGVRSLWLENGSPITDAGWDAALEEVAGLLEAIMGAQNA